MTGVLHEASKKGGKPSFGMVTLRHGEAVL